MDNYMLPLMQLCDSSFPIGAFSHSFGLETYIQEDMVHNKDSFFEWIKVYIQEQMSYTEGFGCRLAYEALENGCLEDIWKLDRMMVAQVLAQESREGSRKMGERLLTLGNQLYPSENLSAYKEQVSSKKCSSHPAIAFAMIAHRLGIPKSTTVLSYMFSVVTSLVQNAVRGIPLGQTEGQRLVSEIQPLIVNSWGVIEKLTEEEFGIASPGLEISQMRHEGIHVRIFMS